MEARIAVFVQSLRFILVSTDWIAPVKCSLANHGVRVSMVFCGGLEREETGGDLGNQLMYSRL